MFRHDQIYHKAFHVLFDLITPDSISSPHNTQNINPYSLKSAYIITRMCKITNYIQFKIILGRKHLLIILLV